MRSARWRERKVKVTEMTQGTARLRAAGVREGGVTLEGEPGREKERREAPGQGARPQKAAQDGRMVLCVAVDA